MGTNKILMWGGTETINQTLIHLYVQAIQMQYAFLFSVHENVFVDIFKHNIVLITT